MQSAARQDWDLEPDEPVADRIVRFPGRSRLDDASEPDPGPPEEPRRLRRTSRRRQATPTPDSVPRYVLTAGGMLLAIVAVGYLLMQLGQIGKQAPPLAAPTTSVPAVPPAAPAQPPVAPAPAPGTGPLRATNRVLEANYAVASGDTLGSIAAKFGTTVEALQSINNLVDRNVLSVGQKLVIPNQQ